jgi:hypothetical protein
MVKVRIQYTAHANYVQKTHQYYCNSYILIKIILIPIHFFNEYDIKIKML